MEPLSEREEIVSTLMYLIKLVKSTVLNVLTYLKVEQYTTKEMKCKGDYAVYCTVPGRFCLRLDERVKARRVLV